MKRLSYQDALKILGYRPSERHVLELLGYEYSERGRQQFKRDAIDIEPHLLSAIARDISIFGVFPRRYLLRKPDVGTCIERNGSSFTLIEKDKPSVWTRWAYPSLESAARTLIRKRCDSAFLTSQLTQETFTSVEHSP